MDNNALIILGFIVSFLTGSAITLLIINYRYLLKDRPRLNHRGREYVRALKSKGYYSIRTR